MLIAIREGQIKRNHKKKDKKYHYLRVAIFINARISPSYTMSQLKYLSNNNLYSGLEEVPFSHVWPIPDSVESQGTEFKRDIHGFHICLGKVPVEEQILSDNELEWPGFSKIKRNNSRNEKFYHSFKLEREQGLVHLSFEHAFYRWDNPIREQVSKEEYVYIPPIINYLMKRGTLDWLIGMSDFAVATYAPNPKLHTFWACLNGIGFVLNDNKLNQGYGSIPPVASKSLDDVLQYRGRFFQENEVRGVNLHLSRERYNDTIRDHLIE